MDPKRIYQIFLFLAFSLMFSSISKANIIPVTNLGDNLLGSLRNVISNAAAGDTITFSALLDGVVIPIDDGEIIVDKNLVIMGNGIRNTILSAGDASRIFMVNNVSDFQLHSISLMDGASTESGGAIFLQSSTAIFIDCEFSNNTSSESGGAIINQGGTLTIDNSIIANNTASGASADQGGGGVFNAGGTVTIQNQTTIMSNVADGASGSGGGIFNDVNGSLMVMASTISGNSAMRAGGGIEDNSGSGTTFTVTNTMITSNTTGSSPGNGGGIHITGPGDLTITGGVVNNNTASAEGGGLWNGSGSMIVDNVNIENNTASGASADQGGGGVFNAGGTITIQNQTTIMSNVADGASGSGGGIFNDVNGSLMVMASTISGNSAMRAGGGIEDNSGAGTIFTVTNTMITSNTTGSSPGNGGGIHITGPGDLTITGGVVSNNTASAEGGGLWNGSGSMIVDNVNIESNTASGASADQGGGGVFNAGGTVTIQNQTTIMSNVADGASGSGGGIFNDANGSLMVMASTISGNSAMRAGGGIEDNSGTGTTFTVTNTTITSNTTGSSPGNGGGIHITGPGDLTITGGVVSNNTASAEGGGLWNGSGSMIVDNVNIENNTASGASADQGGGGVFNAGGTVTIQNQTTIMSNVANGASGSGGGIFNDANGSLMVMASTISGNSAMRAGGGIEDNSGTGTTFTVTNTTITSNTTGSSPGNGGGIHITGPGDLTITGGVVSNNTASAEGGGLWNGSGSMIVDNVNIENNTASGASADQGGGGVFNAGGTVTIQNQTTIMSNVADGASGSGGGIFNDANGSLMVMASTISGNSAMRAGGGIEDNSGSGTTFTVTNTMITSNTTGSSPGNGGGIHITGPGDLTITGGVVSNNTASAEGGGLWNGSGSMIIDNVNIESNTASGASADQGGGGVFNSGGLIEIYSSSIINNQTDGMMGSGAGVQNENSGMVNVFNSTVSSNSSRYNGGGMASNGSLMISNSTVAKNQAGNQGGGIHQTSMMNSAQVKGSIVADNEAQAGGQDVSGMNGVQSMGYNLIGQDDADAFMAQSTDIEGTSENKVDPQLDTLNFYGGNTKTHALLCNSAAIDANDPQDNSNDQRDSAVFNGRKDIGAYEVQNECNVTSTEDFVFGQGGSKLYPNPTNIGVATLEIPQHFGRDIQVSLFRYDGQLMQRIPTGAEKLEVNVSNYAPGMYMVHVKGDSAAEVIKLIIQ